MKIEQGCNNKVIILREFIKGNFSNHTIYYYKYTSEINIKVT